MSSRPRSDLDKRARRVPPQGSKARKPMAGCEQLLRLSGRLVGGPRRSAPELEPIEFSVERHRHIDPLLAVPLAANGGGLEARLVEPERR
jgi:hypothetical protein